MIVHSPAHDLYCPAPIPCFVAALSSNSDIIRIIPLYLKLIFNSLPSYLSASTPGNDIEGQISKGNTKLNVLSVLTF